MTQTRAARRRARMLAFVVPLVAGLGASAACVESPRSIGESCLKNEDCLSGICSSFVCAAPPTLLGSEPSGDGGPVVPPKDAAGDTSPGDDSGGDGAAAGDGPSDSGSADAPSEGGGGDSGPRDGASDAAKKKG